MFSEARARGLLAARTVESGVATIAGHPGECEHASHYRRRCEHVAGTSMLVEGFAESLLAPPGVE